MPTIELSERTFRALQALAQPFVDTPDDVVWRLVSAARDGAEKDEPSTTRPSGHRIESPGQLDALEVDPNRPEDLTHTRIIKAVVDGEDVPRPNWNGLVQLVHLKAMRRLGSIEAVRRITRSNILPGKHEDRGFVYLPDADLSIQGVEARLAWENTLRIARELKIPIAVEFEWYNKEKAAHPGRMASMTWAPPKEKAE